MVIPKLIKFYRRCLLISPRRAVFFLYRFVLWPMSLTGNLDSANAKELHNLFIDLRNRFQQTFLIVTHNEELAQMSDRILHMKDGKII